jgi:hypothetical protein
MSEAASRLNDERRNDLERDPRWLLANRIASSLQRSRRLQELLLFLAERALRHPGTLIREQEIGAAVFGRPATYDASTDTIVRVHIFQLRKRLKEYFENEGTSEAVLVDIPKGSYNLEFVDRPVALPVPQIEPVVARPQRFPWRLGIAGLGILIVGILLGWQLKPIRERMTISAADKFWQQMFGNGRSIELVAADASVTWFQDMLGRSIAIQEYQRREWTRMGSAISDPAQRDLANIVMHHNYTAFAEAVTARNLGVIASRNGASLDIVFARDFSARHLEGGNVILDGHPRANPWMRFVDEKLNFQFGYDEAQPMGYFRNLHPENGEEELYRVAWDRRGYCRVAYLSNLNHTGTVLILAGTDLSSAETGARFVTSNEWIGKLRQRLGLRSGAPMPYFEALLRTDLAVAAAPSFELIAVRNRGK